jgi:hypothetical protein
LLGYRFVYFVNERLPVINEGGIFA